jgi:hypothetical protein
MGGIKMKIKCENVEWIETPQDVVVARFYENSNGSLDSLNGRTFLVHLGSSYHMYVKRKIAKCWTKLKDDCQNVLLTAYVAVLHVHIIFSDGDLQCAQDISQGHI